MSLWKRWHCQPTVGMFVMKGYKKLGRVTAVSLRNDPAHQWMSDTYVDVEWINGTRSANILLRKLRTPEQELEDCERRAELGRRSAKKYDKLAGKVRDVIAKAQQFDFLRQVNSVRKHQPRKKKTA